VILDKQHDPEHVLRTHIVSEAIQLADTPYVWGGNDPAEDGGLDCSGLCIYLFRKHGVIDPNCDMSAQTLYELSKPVKKPKLASLCFYGKDAEHVTHVAIYVGMGRAVSARGGNSSCTTPEIAEARGAAVKVHDYRYRGDYLGTRDFIDGRSE